MIESKKFSMKLLKVKNISLNFRIQKFSQHKSDLKVEKVKKFQRNYLESEKFFPKFSKGKISKT